LTTRGTKFFASFAQFTPSGQSKILRCAQNDSIMESSDSSPVGPKGWEGVKKSGWLAAAAV